MISTLSLVVTRSFPQVMKNLYSLAVAQLTVGGAGSEAGVTPVGEEDMEWMKENFVLDQLNAAISALGTEEVRTKRGLYARGTRRSSLCAS